jgi:hypothetical protein
MRKDSVDGRMEIESRPDISDLLICILYICIPQYPIGVMNKSRTQVTGRTLRSFYSPAPTPVIFSAMKIIKTGLRHKMGNDWLNHMMICYIERVIFASIKDDDILYH